MQAYSITDIIRKKRDGDELTGEEILRVVEGASQGLVPDYQLSALLMAIYFRGMSGRETSYLTSAMAASGERLDLSGIDLPKVDKHSTGGVGDKVSMVLAPIVASCGIVIPKISGRGLGHTGGTVDKLESIPGFRAALSIEEIESQVRRIGIAMAAQTEQIAPADRKLYALRDVTGTVESLPLITASILAKKFAEDLDALVLDVKVGAGAFMKRIEDARALAESVRSVAGAYGLRCTTSITRMDAPLGTRIGNWLEVCEAVRMLRGEEEPPLLAEVTYAVAGACIRAAGLVPDLDEGIARARAAVEDGRAYAKFLELVRYQGGDVATVEMAHEPPPNEVILSDRSGYVTAIDSRRLGLLAIDLGAGRHVMDDEIAPHAGIILYRHLGDAVERGEPLCGVVVRRAGMTPVPDDYRAAFSIGEERPEARSCVVESQE